MTENTKDRSFHYQQLRQNMPDWHDLLIEIFQDDDLDVFLDELQNMFEDEINRIKGDR